MTMTITMHRGAPVRDGRALVAVIHVVRANPRDVDTHLSAHCRDTAIYRYNEACILTSNPQSGPWMCWGYTTFALFDDARWVLIPDSDVAYFISRFGGATTISETRTAPHVAALAPPGRDPGALLTGDDVVFTCSTIRDADAYRWPTSQMFYLRGLAIACDRRHVCESDTYQLTGNDHIWNQIVVFGDGRWGIAYDREATVNHILHRTRVNAA